MIRHIVFWNVKNSVTRNEDAHRIKQLLEGLKEKIPEIVELEVGIDIVREESSADIALNTLFQSVEDLKAYQAHPAHVEAVSILRQFTHARRVIDYPL